MVDVNEVCVKVVYKWEWVCVREWVWVRMCVGVDCFLLLVVKRGWRKYGKKRKKRKRKRKKDQTTLLRTCLIARWWLHSSRIASCSKRDFLFRLLSCSSLILPRFATFFVLFKAGRNGSASWAQLTSLLFHMAHDLIWGVFPLANLASRV